jgi:hypothetical protein
MANVINEFLTQLGAGTNLKDYKHASRLFVDGNYRLLPKSGYMYHVAFDFNPLLNKLSNDSILESGMLVKSAQLPKFNIDNKTYNAYNRPNVVQTKLKYEPINITFHDDSADIIRYFWWNYVSHYYRDSDHTEQEFAQPSKYEERQSQSWGYSPANYSSNGAVERMLTAIRIYSLHQRNFTEYVLINPTITSFKFGDHSSGSTELMETQMTVAYESVLYNYGQVVPGQTVNGFAQLHYDRTPSPLTPQGGGTQSILGPGGLLSALDSVDHQLGQGNFFGAALTAFKSFNNFKGANFGQMAGTELRQLGTNILNGNNPLAKIQIPTLGGGSSNGSNTFGVAGGASALLMLLGAGGAQGRNNAQAILRANPQFNSMEELLASQGIPNNQAGVVTSNGDPVATAYPVGNDMVGVTVTTLPNGQRLLSYDTTQYSSAAKVAEYERVIAAGGSEQAAQNSAASVGSDAGARALESINMNNRPLDPSNPADYQQLIRQEMANPNSSVIRKPAYDPVQFEKDYGKPGDRTSPAAATFLGGATSTQGAVTNPPVDYTSPQFQSQEQIDAEIAAEKARAGDF